MNQPALPVARGLPLVGSFFEFRKRRLDLQMRMLRECGDMGIFKMGPIAVYAVSSAALAQEVLVDRAADFKKSRGLARFGRPLLGNGLLTAEADFHKKQRRLIAPAFQHKRIANYAAAFASLGERIQMEWADGAQIDLAAEMMRLTLAIVGKTLFDADLTGDAADVGRALTDAMHWMIDNVSAPLPIPTSIPTSKNRKLKRAIETLDRIVLRIIRERRAAREDRGDVLSMLLLAQDEDDGSTMTDAQVRDEVMTLFLAGHETTANALAWSFYLLARHPEVSRRLREESDKVLGGRTPAFEDLPNLPYSLQVLKESMRLYPPAYMVGRQALQPVEIGGHLIPKDGIVFINIYAIHHRPDYFPDPDRFNPDRFTPESEKQLPRGAYTPFGGGPRICIGNHFALMEGQILLSALSQRVTFTPLSNEDVVPEPLVTLRPKGGMPMRVSRR